MHTFTTPDPITAVVDIAAGRVQVIAADRADTTVQIRPADPASHRDVQAAEQTTADYRDGVLRITAPAANRVLGSSGTIEVTVQLPAGSRLDAKAASAQLRTVGRLGALTVDSQQATIKADDAATARLTTLSGDVTVGRLHGDAQISTGKGDITITEAVRGALDLRTQAGTITVDAAAGVCAALDAGTTYGRINNALKNTDGTPALTIHATTAYGDITARSL